MDEAEANKANLKKKLTATEERIIKENKNYKEWVDKHDTLRLAGIATIKDIEEKIWENATLGEAWHEKALQLHSCLKLLHNIYPDHAGVYKELDAIDSDYKNKFPPPHSLDGGDIIVPPKEEELIEFSDKTTENAGKH